MRVLVLTDASFAQREHLLLTRLEIGLADEGAAVIHAVPASCSQDLVSAFSSTVVRYDDTPTPFGRAMRARQLYNAACEQLDTSELRIDVIHAFGRQSWRLAHALAQHTGAALVLEVWRADLARAAVRKLAIFRRPGRGSVPPLSRIGLLTSSEQIAEELRRLPGHEQAVIGVAPWGVPATDSLRPPIDPKEAIAVSIVADGRGASSNRFRLNRSSEYAELRALLEGLQRMMRRYPNLLVFLDGAAADRAPVWHAARRLGLLDRLTAVADMEGRREPILQTDILLVPEPNGVCRTLPLAAMADGVAIIARPDQHHADWLNQTTARLVGHSPGQSSGRIATPEEWEQVITACIQESQRTASMRSVARSLVRQQRTVTAYVEGVRRMYDQVAAEAVASSATTIVTL